MGCCFIIKNQDQEARTIPDLENDTTVEELKRKYGDVADMAVDSMRFVCGGAEC